MAKTQLRILFHNGTEEIRIVTDGNYGIGRAEENWLCPLDKTLSRSHSRLLMQDGNLRIEALSSRNGTFVNGKKIASQWLLGFGDEIVVGQTRIVVCEDPQAADDRRHQETLELAVTQDDYGDEYDDEIVAADAVMIKLKEQARKFAASDLPVLITGESGTGKELFARRIHECSNRKQQPLVIINCPALASGVLVSELFGVEAGVATGVEKRRGRLEEADGGTLFLDEVADLPLEAQAILLRFLSDGIIERLGGRRQIPLDVRILAATNKDLEAAIAEGAFRGDLFFRLNVLHMDIPPLRKRVDDILPLVSHILQKRGKSDVSVTAQAITALEKYPYPGNVRELAALIERAALLCDGDEIDVDSFDFQNSSCTEGDPGNIEGQAEALLDGIVSGDVDFWKQVYTPFQEREFSRPLLRLLVKLGLARCDGTVKSLATVLRVEPQYRKLLDFVRNNRLMP